MAKFTAKQLNALVYDLNQNELKEKPWGFRVEGNRLSIVRRKGGESEVICRGSTYDLHRGIEIVLTAQTQRCHAIFNQGSESTVL